MILYHGSDTEIPRPDITYSRGMLDFGRGFYLTSIRSQAERWARRKAMRSRKGPILNLYRFDESSLSSLDVKAFPENDAEWLEFVCSCRGSEVATHSYDLVIGGVADDKVYYAVNMYVDGLWDVQTTLAALKFYDRNDQYCFATQEAIDDSLVFLRAEALQ